MTDTKALVARLRELAHPFAESLSEYRRLNAFVKCGTEAADALEAALAENERLREIFRLDGEMHASAIREARQDQQARIDAYAAEIGRLRMRVTALQRLVSAFQSYGCPICNGDCGSANPPMYYCPMQEARSLLGDTHDNG